jgi:hypothetical protein
MNPFMRFAIAGKTGAIKPIVRVKGARNPFKKEPKMKPLETGVGVESRRTFSYLGHLPPRMKRKVLQGLKGRRKIYRFLKTKGPYIMAITLPLLGALRGSEGLIKVGALMTENIGLPPELQGAIRGLSVRLQPKEPSPFERIMRKHNVGVVPNQPRSHSSSIFPLIISRDHLTPF